MERDASLDEFLDASVADDDGSEEGDPSPGESSAESATVDASSDDQPTETTAESSTVDPAAVTARWDPDGEPCADCGAVVDRRWRDGDDFLCTDCKEW